jgi:hypothetical protein
MPWETEIGRMGVQGQPKQIVYVTHLQNNHSKMDWKCGSSSKAPALQMQIPEFEPQSHQKKKKIRSYLTLAVIIKTEDFLYY